MASAMDGGGRVSMGRLLVDFSTWSTVACLARIAEGGKVIKILFTLILIAMIIMCTYASVGCLRKFISYPSSTELELDIQSLKFPRISFCNENPLKRSAVDWDNIVELFSISSMITQYEGTALGEMATTSYGLLGSPRALHQMRRAQVMLRLQMAQLTKANRKDSGYTYEDLVTECSIAGETCSSANFKHFLHPQYGNCYTFISDVDITRPGTQQQFRMLFTVNQDWPNPTSRKQAIDYLPTTDSAAIWAVIHQPDEFPDFSRNGIRIGVGTQAIVSLSKTEHHRLGPPYGNCIEQGKDSDNYYQNYTYTMNTCQQSCLQRHAQSKCGCVDPLFLKAKNHTHCTTPEQMECLLFLTRDISPPNSTEGRTMCECRPACEETLLEKTVSYTAFPARKYNVAAGTQQQRRSLLQAQGGGRSGSGADGQQYYDPPTTTTTTSGPSGRRKRAAPSATDPPKVATVVDRPGFGSCEFANKNFRGAGDCIEWYRRNAAVLQVYYENLRVSTYTQAVDYPFVTLLSDVSGHAGLWLGFSVVTMVEIVSFLFVCLNNFLCKKKVVENGESDLKPKQSTTESVMSKDDDGKYTDNSYVSEDDEGLQKTISKTK